MNKIIVYGDFFLDEYIEGNCSRISPERPIPVLEYKGVTINAGGAGNVIINLKNIGADVLPIGFLGKDATSDKIISLLKKKKINTYYIYISKNINGISKTRIISGQQQIVRIDKELEYFYQSKKYSNHICKIFASLTNNNNVKFFIISDYGKGCAEPKLIKKLIKICNEKNISVIIDPSKKKNNIDTYSNSFAITPNINELKLINPNLKESELDILKTAKKIIKNNNIKNIIITRGEKGISMINKNKNYKFKPLQKQVFDVSGAGDTVIAVITHLLNKGYNILKAVKVANLCAGHVVGLLNTQPISKKDFMYYLKKHSKY